MITVCKGCKKEYKARNHFYNVAEYAERVEDENWLFICNSCYKKLYNNGNLKFRENNIPLVKKGIKVIFI